MTTVRTQQPRLLISLVLGIAIFVATVAYAHLKVEKTLPADGATVQELDTLRVWFNQEPDVALSKLQLEGPSGEIEVDNMHSMGEKDLMGQILVEVPSGKYTASWQTAGDDGHVQKGEWTFIVE